MNNAINRNKQSEKYFLASISIIKTSSNCTEYGQFLFKYKRYQEAITYLKLAISIYNDECSIVYNDQEKIIFRFCFAN